MLNHLSAYRRGQIKIVILKLQRELARLDWQLAKPCASDLEWAPKLKVLARKMRVKHTLFKCWDAIVS